MNNKEEEKWSDFFLAIFIGSIALTMCSICSYIEVKRQNDELRRQLEDYKVLIDLLKESEK
jgi:hypothetical protein